VGLDLGATEFRSIRDSGGDLMARRCCASYLVIKNTPGHRRLIESIQARHGTCGDDLVVLGDDAIECGQMLNLPVLPLMRNGRLPSGDPVARQIVALMVEAVLPRSEEPGAACCITVPGGYGLDGDQQSLDVRYFQQVAALRGYAPRVMSSGQAIVLAELSSASFSGLGVSLGAINCEISVVHCGRELARCTVPSPWDELKEGNVDSVGGAAIEESAESKRAWQHDCTRRLTAMLTQARESLVSEGSLRLIQQPTSVACSGSITQTEGFASLFQQAWSQSSWPLRVSQISMATNPRFTVARGNLIKAILESRPAPNSRVA
jgi:hypothetical protein